LDLILGTLEIPIIQASDGKEALTVIKDNSPILIVLDLEMPNLDGKTVRRILKDDPATADIPILVFTAYQVTPRLAKELEIEEERLLQKGSISMTHLRDKVIELIRDSISIDLSLIGYE
jgi:CheY-like chemotaxis protein